MAIQIGPSICGFRIPGFMGLEYATRKKEMANKFQVMLLIKCLNWMDCNMLLDNLHLTEAAFRNRSMI
uniref:Uncharacterized protein n=1 Tax=Oryza meridionalis TaxID=40149 RepID=A0A0E0EG34_9ORYZ